MSFVDVEGCDDFRMSEEGDEDDHSVGNRPNFALVTLQDTDEMTVIPSKWLNTDKTQCHWPPFRSAEKFMEAVRVRLEPSTAGQPWGMLKIFLHEEYDTYEEAVKKQALKAQKRGVYAVVTLLESNELTVIPANWLKTQCYWPPFKTPEKWLAAVKNRLEPDKRKSPWELLNVVLHGEYATYQQAKEKEDAINKQMELPSTRSFEKHRHRISTPQTSWSTQTFAKRKCPNESTNRTDPLLTTDMGVMKTRQIMEDVNHKIKDPHILDQALKSYFGEAISNMNEIFVKKRKNKTTIGIFGKSGEGKSSLLSAILGEEDLLPSGSFGACTAVVTQVEANLSDSNYIAEIKLISKEEWEKDLQECFEVLSDEIEDRDDNMIEIAKEKITAVYGEGAHKKTLEELKNHPKNTEIKDFLSTCDKTISQSNASDFANDVACYIQHSEASPGGWYWPLVKSVTMKIPNCHELLEHIVLVDIPGTGDCNKNRDDVWKTKLRDCASVWVVSAINRATTDKGPWEMLKHCIEELGPGGECKSINFICTMTDDITPKAYCRAARLPDMTSTADCIRHRNDCTKKKMDEKFESLNPEIKKMMDKFSKDVFTVSSKAFFEQNLVVKEIDTEIPKLQDVLKNLNKSRNRQLTRDYVNEAKGVLSLIQSFPPNTDEELAQNKARFYHNLKKNLNKALMELDSEFDKLLNDLDQCLSKGVLMSVEQSFETARTEIIEPEIDNRGYHKIFKALCKNGGCYSPKNWEKTLDLNACLARHMKININEEFLLIFSVEGNTGKSVKEQLDKFSIIQSKNTYPRSSMFHHIQNFIKTQEDKLKPTCYEEALERKKEMYAIIEPTIKRRLTPGYEKAARVTGKGSLKKMQNILLQTIESLKDEMFNEAKDEVLKRFRTLKLYIKDHLKSELSKSLEVFLPTTSTITHLDVSREIEGLESLFEQLSG